LRKNISRKAWLLFLAGEFFFVVQSILSFFIPLAQKELINTAMSGNTESLDAKSVVCLVLALAMSLAFTASTQFGGHSYGEAWRSLSLKVFERTFGQRFPVVMKRGISWYRMMIFGETILIPLCSIYSESMLALVQLVAILLIVGKWSASLVYVILGVNAVYMLLLVLVTSLDNKYAEAYTEEDLKAGAMVQNDFNLARTLHRFGRSDAEIKRFGKQVELLAASGAKKQAVSLFRNSSYEVLSSLTMVALVFAGLAAFRRGALDVSGLVTVIAFIPQILLPCQSIASVLEVEAVTRPVKARYETIQSDYEATFPETFALPDLDAAEIISLRNISFSYANTDCATASADATSLENADALRNVAATHIGGFDMRCDTNSSTALLGLSGEGKSTIVKLCTGEEGPGSGEVFFCNADISALPSPVQNAFINLYSQEIDIIDDDALGNILMGKTLIPRASVASTLQAIRERFEDSLEALRRCDSKTALFKELGKKRHEPLRIMLGLPLWSRLPESREVGLMESLLQWYTNAEIAAVLAEADFGRTYCVRETVDTLIDATKIRHLLGRKLGIGGAGISGGERQRIALARCLAKESWKLLIVDEPFTSLDALAEDELSQVLRAYTRGNSDTGDARGNRDPCDNRGKTLLLVTHKLNLVPLLTDHIILLDQGGVAAQGTHAELLDDSELYASLWKAFSAQRA